MHALRVMNNKQWHYRALTHAEGAHKVAVQLLKRIVPGRSIDSPNSTSLSTSAGEGYLQNQSQLSAQSDTCAFLLSLMLSCRGLRLSLCLTWTDDLKPSLLWSSRGLILPGP